MACAQKSKIFERLQKDTSMIFGDRITMRELCDVLGFGSRGALKRAINGSLQLAVYCDALSGETYVRREELIEMLTSRYDEAEKSDA